MQPYKLYIYILCFAFCAKTFHARFHLYFMFFFTIYCIGCFSFLIISCYINIIYNLHETYKKGLEMVLIINQSEKLHCHNKVSVTFLKTNYYLFNFICYELHRTVSCLFCGYDKICDEKKFETFNQKEINKFLYESIFIYSIINYTKTSLILWRCKIWNLSSKINWISKFRTYFRKVSKQDQIFRKQNAFALWKILIVWKIKYSLVIGLQYKKLL